MGNPIVHWELTGPDAKQLQRFYTTLFDWQIEPWRVGGESPDDYAVIKTGSVDGGICRSDRPSITFYVAVDDLQAALDKAESMGGQTVTPPMPIPNVGAFALFRDPAGNVVGLFNG